MTESKCAWFFAAGLMVFGTVRADLPVASQLDVPRSKSDNLRPASEADVKWCESAFASPRNGEIVFRSSVAGSWIIPSSWMAIAKLDDGRYVVIDASEIGAGSAPEVLETPLALRILELFHSELERPRSRKPTGLVVDVATVVWIESRPGLEKRTGETFENVDRDTRLGRMVELAAALCRFRDCPKDERVRAINQLEQIVTELEVALKFEALPGK